MNTTLFKSICKHLNISALLPPIFRIFGLIFVVYQSNQCSYKWTDIRNLHPLSCDSRFKSQCNSSITLHSIEAIYITHQIQNLNMKYLSNPLFVMEKTAILFINGYKSPYNHRFGCVFGLKNMSNNDLQPRRICHSIFSRFAITFFFDEKSTIFAKKSLVFMRLEDLENFKGGLQLKISIFYYDVYNTKMTVKMWFFIQ